MHATEDQVTWQELLNLILGGTATQRQIDDICRLINQLTPGTITMTGTPAERRQEALDYIGTMTPTAGIPAPQGEAIASILGILIIVTPSPLPAEQERTPMSRQLVALGGTDPLVWDHTGGNLPPGTSLNPSGQLRGTPTSAGLFNFTVMVRDRMGNRRSANYELHVMGLAAFCITAPAVITFRVNNPMTEMLTANLPGASWAVTGAPGFVHVEPNGLLHGTPDESSIGIHRFAVTARMPDGRSDTVILEIRINPQTLRITSLPTPPGQEGQRYSFGLQAEGGTGGYGFRLVGFGDIPHGMSIARNGELRGIPTQHGDFNFQVEVEDSAGSIANEWFGLHIDPPAPAPLRIATSSPLPRGRMHRHYSPVTLTASGGSGNYVDWRVIAGTMVPDGLTLRHDGVITGIPREYGGNFVVEVEDDAGHTAARTFEIPMDPAPWHINPAVLTWIGLVALLGVLAWGLWNALPTSPGTQQPPQAPGQPAAPTQPQAPAPGGGGQPTVGFAPYGTASANVPRESETTLTFSVNPGQMVAITGGPMAFGGHKFSGGVDRGTVMVFKGGDSVVRKQITDLISGGNWMQPYTGSDAQGLANDRIAAMNAAPNCTSGKGCSTVDFLVVNAEDDSVIASGTR